MLQRLKEPRVCQEKPRKSGVLHHVQQVQVSELGSGMFLKDPPVQNLVIGLR